MNSAPIEQWPDPDPAGERVIFVEGVSEDERYVRNVFVSSMQNQRLGVTMAATGHQEIAENGDRFIVLQNGRRYEMQPGSPEFRIMEYARYAVRVETKEARGIERTPKNTPTLDLIGNESRAHQAELLGRGIFVVIKIHHIAMKIGGFHDSEVHRCRIDAGGDQRGQKRCAKLDHQRHPFFRSKTQI